MNEPLKNSKHEKFALLVVSGKGHAEAYKKVYGGPLATASANAARLLRSDRFGVAERIRWLKSQSASKTVLSSSERREYMAKVVRCPTELPKDWKKEFDGVIEVEVDEKGKPRFTTPTRQERIKAAMEDAKLAGDLIDKSDLVNGEGEALPAVLPTIVVNVPKAWVVRRKG